MRGPRASRVLAVVLALPIAGAGCSTLLGIEDFPVPSSADGGADGAVTTDAPAMNDTMTSPEVNAPADAGDAGDVRVVESGACQPFEIAPCAPTYRCDFVRPNGDTQCKSLHGAGAGEGQTCVVRDDCSEGLDCFSQIGSDGSSPDVCLMMCLTPGATQLPFDAAALAKGPLTGGCSAGKTCRFLADPAIFPPWISVCF